MRSLISALVALTSLSIYGQSKWTEMSPLEYCPEFKIEYQINSDGAYQVRIPGPVAPEYIARDLANINDLSSLSDTLVEKSLQVCNISSNPVEIQGRLLVFEEEINYETRVCAQPIRYTQPYAELARELVDILQFTGNRCDQLMAYTELQTKIEQLSEEDLITLEKPGNLFHRAIQLFSDEETDRMVSLYNACGGKKFTDKFVSNLILLEAKKACIMPNPPGMMSFKETKEIAMAVAKDYNDLSLMGINSKKDEITKKAVLAFVNEILKKEINGLLGDELQDLDAFIGNLEAVKEINSIDMEEAGSEYIGLGFTFDATMEVAGKALPVLAESSFKERLPASWSDKQKNRYFYDQMLPELEKNYASCMRPHHEKTLFGQNATTKQKLKARGKLKKRYCKNHPDQCQENTCGSSINILSGDPGVTDAQVVQGCVMETLLKGVKPLIKESIADQKKTFEKDFELTDKMVNDLTDKTWSGLLHCANRQVLEANGESHTAYNDQHNPPILSEKRHLQSSAPDRFEKIITDCADMAQVNVGKRFFAQTLINQDILLEEFSEGTDEEVDSILSKTYDTCIMKQHFNQIQSQSDTVTRNPLLCVPLVEMETAKRVIGKTIKKTFLEAGVSPHSPEAALSLKKFENCAEDAIAASQEGIGTPSGEIPDEQAASIFLEQDVRFVSCVKEAVLDAVSVAGSKIFDDEIDKMAKDLSRPDYVRGLKDGALAKTKQCFSRGLEESKNWREFVEFNDADGLAKLQTKCESAALDYILPKALIKETASQLAELKDQELIKNDTEIGNVLAFAAYKLRDKYKLKLPAGTKGDDIVEWSYAQAHNAHIAIQGNTTESFVAEFTALAMDKAIETLHKNIQEKTRELAGGVYDDFYQAVSPQCLYKGFVKFEDQITELTTEMAKMPKESPAPPALLQVTEAIIEGLEYQKSLGGNAYEKKLGQLQSMCAGVDKFNSPMELAQTGSLDFIIKGALQKTLQESFEEIAKDQCLKDLRKAAPYKSFDALIRRTCEAKTSFNAVNFFSRILTKEPVAGDKNAQREIGFIQERHLEMKALIGDTLAKPHFIERAILSENPSPIMDYVYQNFTGVMTEDKQVMNNLTATIAQKLFSDQSSGGFADRFAKTQLTAGLGMAGYEQAYQSITIQKLDESLGWLDLFISKNKALKVSREALDKKWTVEGITEMIAWDEIDQWQRKGLMDSLYQNAIAPTLNGGIMNEEGIADDLGRHAAEYKYSKDNKSFEERLTEFITKYVEENKWRILG